MDASKPHTLICGDVLKVLPTLVADSFDMVLADPPYASGGQYRADKAAPTSVKYQNTGTDKTYRGGDFEGDGLDQRSWIRWTAEWLREAKRVTKPGGYALVFTDWRQLPALTDAIQMAGWHWRGIIAWNKGLSSRAPHKGYVRHQCEYVVWATRGACKKAIHAGPFPGCYNVQVNHNHKRHVAGKPVELLTQLLNIVPKGSNILDPFCGSGSTLIAARQQGHTATGVELSPQCYAVAEAWLNEPCRA
jgi:site-specific DNA-methyltransferase (adenine-specific)